MVACYWCEQIILFQKLISFLISEKEAVPFAVLLVVAIYATVAAIFYFE